MDIDPKIQLAIRQFQSGHSTEAEALCRQLLAQHPRNAQALQLLGQIAHQAGRNAEAVELMRRVLETDPANPVFHGNLGAVLAAGGQFAEAEIQLREALGLKPDFVEGYSNLGNILLQQGKVEDAIGVYRTAARLRPQSPEGFYNLGAALQRAQRWDEAIVAYKQAIAIKPDYAEAFNNLGSVFSENGRLDEGIAAFRQALQIQPRHLHAMNNLAAALQERGEIDEAIATYRRALEIKPDPRVAGNLIISMHLRPEDDPKVIRAEVDKWNSVYAKPLSASRRVHNNTPDPDRRLKVGYVSRDFNRAPVGRFMVPALANHDHSRIEVVAYSDVTQPDPVTDRLRGYCDRWNDVAGLTDAQLTERVFADGVDVLVDLGMHTKGSRILTFAMKPAPVQVSYLAYCSTTGLETMDYRLTDPYLDPPDRDPALYSERSVHLSSYWCYAAPAEAPEIQPPPCQSSGFITFGCLNNFCKISAAAFEIWCTVLNAVPNSRLMLHALEGAHRKHALERVKSVGIDPARIEFINRLPVAQYFRQYNEIDIALDPFPYPGGTTSCDALWMGVPLVTFAGRTAVARGGVSILSNVGLPGLIARSREQYVAIAADLAADRSRLASLRASMRKQMQSSPLMDGRRFARELETAYRAMWRNWCASQSQTPQALYNLAQSNRRAGDIDAAIRLYKQAIELRPDFVESWNNLGTALKQIGRIDEAISAYHKAIAIRPEDVEPRYNLGNALAEAGNVGEAIDVYKAALSSEPRAAHVIAALGNAHRDCGEIATALDCYRQSLTIAPAPDVASNLAYTLYLDPGAEPADILKAHQDWDAMFAQPLASEIVPHANDRSPDRPIRIGYVSPDLSMHPVGRFMLPILANHNGKSFEVYCYSDGPEDEITARMRSFAQAWRTSRGMSDPKLADQIRTDAIDILVDLSLHTRQNRLLAFARKPAPVQLSYLAYCGTTGLSTIDYRLTDPHLDPPGQGDADYSERSIRLPESYWCFQPLDTMPGIAPSPANETGYVTFASFGSFAKVSPPAIQAWMRILQSISKSRLLIHAPLGPHRDRVLETAKSLGIAPDRIEFFHRLPLPDYFQLFRRVDVSLDSFPCSGATVICDALWMGVPVVTLAGRAAMGRSGSSVLFNAGVSELVARDVDQYVSTAVKVACNASELSNLRLTLRQRMTRSPLMNAAQFTLGFEAALRQMWRTWCEGNR